MGNFALNFIKFYTAGSEAAEQGTSRCKRVNIVSSVGQCMGFWCVRDTSNSISLNPVCARRQDFIFASGMYEGLLVLW